MVKTSRELGRTTRECQKTNRRTGQTMGPGKYVRRKVNGPGKDKNHSGHNPKKSRECAENWSDSRNNNG